MNPIILIQVSLKSKRLPFKALRPLYGQPLIRRLIERIDVGIPIMIATSTEPMDALFNDFRLGAAATRGPLEDLAARFLDASGEANPIIRVTGDNPLTDPNILLDCLAAWRAGAYVCPVNVPRGVKCDVFDRGLLEQMPLDDQEHRFTEYLRAAAGDNIIEIDYHSDPNLMLGCDTREDYERLCRIYDHFAGRPPADLAAIIAYARSLG